ILLPTALPAVFRVNLHTDKCDDVKVREVNAELPGQVEEDEEGSGQPFAEHAVRPGTGLRGNGHLSVVAHSECHRLALTRVTSVNLYSEPNSTLTRFVQCRASVCAQQPRGRPA
uniref:Uncharacterized protein n=1 Tax=Coturnix japonica TaxID=93934 RepID=A0A8C2YE06_COTJA